MKGHWNGYSWHPDEKSDVYEFVSDNEAKEYYEEERSNEDGKAEDNRMFTRGNSRV